MRALIVDDSRTSLMVLQNTLVQGGYEVTTAANGREALVTLQQGGHRLVICDWEMPEMNGLDLCRAIRAENLLGYTYIIILTTHGTIEEKVQGLLAGADDFIAKPFHPAELMARVQIAERLLSLETRDVAMFALAKLAESRDPETGEHLERVRTYCRVLAQHLASTDKFREVITVEYIRLLYLTSSLHDIGKVGIPDKVLLKPGPLNDNEFEIMKRHTTIGAETLDATLKQFPGVEYLQMARDIAASHHERFNGTGYPKGLRGEQIPLCGRIVAQADVYDALTTKRVYKAAYTHEMARSIILSEAGEHFDPDIVDAFIQTETRFSAIRDKLSEHYAMAA